MRSHVGTRSLILTGAGHGGGVALRAEVVLLAAAVQRPLVVGDAVRRTL